MVFVCCCGGKNERPGDCSIIANQRVSAEGQRRGRLAVSRKALAAGVSAAITTRPLCGWEGEAPAEPRGALDVTMPKVRGEVDG